MLNDQEIRSEYEDNYRYSNDYWNPFIQQAQVYTLAAAGQTWSGPEIQKFLHENREPLELNIMRRPLQFFSGYLRDNLNSIVIGPVEGSDQKTADQFTTLSYDAWDKGNGYNTFLDSCDEGMKSGIALCGLQMDYRRDFINGEIGFFKRTSNAFLLDPTFEQIDLEDCSFAITRDLLNKDLVKSLLPFIDPQMIDDIHGGIHDNKFLKFHPNFGNVRDKRNVIAYDQYYKRITKKRLMLVDRDGSDYKDVTDYDKDKKEQLRMGIKRLHDLHRDADLLGIDRRDLPPLVELETVDRGFVELNIMLNGQRVWDGEDKTKINETYPFAPVMWYFEPSIWNPSQRIQGLPSTLYSANRQFNKRHMKIVDMMDTDISTGFKYLLGSVPDPEELKQAGQSRIIGVDPANAPEGLNSVQQLTGGGTNPTLIEYQKILDDLTLTLANVNESVLGIDEKGNTQVSGRLAQVRIAQGLRSNRKVFDNIEFSQKILGGLVLKAIQRNYTPAKVKRILGEDPTDQFYNDDFEQYDAIVKEGIRSQSQKDAYYQELVTLKREEIVNVPEVEIIDALQMAGMSKLQKAIAKQSKQQAAQEKETQDKANALVEATMEDKKALAHERNTRADANEGLRMERASESVQNMAKAELDRAKAIVEISQLEDSRIIEALRIMNEITAQEEAKKEMQDAKIDIESDEKETTKGNTAASLTS